MKARCPNCHKNWSKTATWAFETSNQAYHVIHKPTKINCGCGTTFEVHPKMEDRKGALT